MSSSTLTLPPDDDTARLHRARWATRLQFMVIGVFSGIWGVHIPSVKSRYELNEALLAAVLFTAAMGAVTSLLIAGRVIGRLGARQAALASGVVMSLALPLTLQMPALAVLLPVAFVLGAGSSLFDVAINAEGSELEHRGGRALMSNLHAMFSVGGMVGAGVGAVLLKIEMAPGLQLALVGLALAVTVVLGTRGMLDTHGEPAAGEADAHFAWPRGLLLVVGLLILAGMISEGVMFDWSVLYLKQELGLPQSQAALGYVAFATAMAASRFAGDTLRERYAERTLLRVGASVAAVAMATLLLARDPVVAMVGYALIGAGLAPIAPILYNAATRVPGVSRAAAIASVTSIGYSGFMIGPPLIGGIAHATSLSLALGIVVLSAGTLALCARFVPAKA